jgi:hypothetical protein
MKKHGEALFARGLFELHACFSRPPEAGLGGGLDDNGEGF